MMLQANRPVTKVLLNFLKIIFAIILLWWLWRGGGLDWQTIAGVHFSWALAGVILFQILMIGTLTWRWFLLLRAGNTPISFKATCVITLRGQCTSTFIPGSIGIDGVRLYQLRQILDSGRATAMMSILWDRVLGIGALLLLTVICTSLLLMRPLPLSLKSTFVAITLLSACLLALPLSLVLPQNPLRRLLQNWHLLRKLPTAPANKSTFITSGILACFTHLCNGMALICAFYAMGQTAPVTTSLLLMPLIILSGLIPLTPLGLGISDAVALLLFNTIHISNGANAMMLGRISFVIISACCGLAWFVSMQSSHRNTTINET